MATFLERYQNGEREQVWTELVALGKKVRDEPVFSDAREVARETMRRTRTNVELLYQRLNSLGYIFEYPHEAFIAPTPTLIAQLDEFEREVGLIPLSLRAWSEIVGEVNFIGNYRDLSYYGESTATGVPKDLPFVQSDPLVVEVRHDISVKDYKAWDDWAQGVPFYTSIAPDDVHKTNTSGGPPYNILLPNADADALVENEWHDTLFVPYLRIVFEWGGFPGLEDEENVPHELLKMLKEGLLPI